MRKQFFSSKTYTHAEGLSCCFRQWRATHSHCQKLHGYAIQVELWFSSEQLDERNWVMDFGGLKAVKAMLKEKFDHKTIVAIDDPQLEEFRRLEKIGILDLTVLPAVGCERFADYIMEAVQGMIPKHITVEAVEVREHAGNSAKVIKNHWEIIGV